MNQEKIFQNIKKRKAPKNDILEQEFRPKQKKVKKEKKIIPLDQLKFCTLSSPLLPHFQDAFEIMEFKMTYHQFEHSALKIQHHFEIVSISQIEAENILEKHIVENHENPSDSSDEEKVKKTSCKIKKEMKRKEYIEQRKQVLRLHLDQYQPSRIACYCLQIFFLSIE